MAIDLPRGVDPNEPWEVGEMRTVTVSFKLPIVGSLFRGIREENFHKWINLVKQTGYFRVPRIKRLDAKGGSAIDSGLPVVGAEVDLVLLKSPD